MNHYSEIKEAFLEHLVGKYQLIIQIVNELPGLWLQSIVHSQIHHWMLKQSGIHQVLWILLLDLLQISVCLLPCDSIDQIPNQVKNVLFFFRQWQFLLDSLYICNHLFLTCNASLEIPCLNSEQVPWIPG